MASRRGTLYTSLDPASLNTGGVFYASNLLSHGYSPSEVLESLMAAGFAASLAASLLGLAESAVSIGGGSGPPSPQLPPSGSIPVTPGTMGQTVTIRVAVSLPCTYVGSRGLRYSKIISQVFNINIDDWPPDMDALIETTKQMLSDKGYECDDSSASYDIEYIIRS